MRESSLPRLRKMIIVLSVITLWSGCNTFTSRRVSVPGNEDVSSITVRLNGREVRDRDEDTKPFILLATDANIVLGLLSRFPSECDSRYVDGPSIIEMNVLMNDGKQHTITIPVCYQEQLMFVYDGVAVQRQGEYAKRNPITGEPTVFFPDESILLYWFLKEASKRGMADVHNLGETK